MGADAVLTAVEHRPQVEVQFEVAPTAFDLQQLLVAERDVLAERVGSEVRSRNLPSSDYKVEGEITITNPAAIDQTITAITDVPGPHSGTVATVDCPSMTVAAGATMVCTYEAFPPDATDVNNTAVVKADGNKPRTAKTPIVWTENLIGYDEGTLTDERSEYSELISSSTTVTFDEDFACPASDSGLYVDGFYSFTETNVATLNGNIGLTADATVTVECRRVFQDETVTGAGLNWSDVGKGKTSTNNWFQYTVGTEGTFDLVSGRQLKIVGDVTITPLGDGTTELAFAFDSPWQLADVSGNVKIEPLDAEPKVYLEPGNFSHHFTEPDDLDDESPNRVLGDRPNRELRLRHPSYCQMLWTGWSVMFRRRAPRRCLGGAGCSSLVAVRR
jgi:hypothetical protein